MVGELGACRGKPAKPAATHLTNAKATETRIKVVYVSEDTGVVVCLQTGNIVVVFFACINVVW